jgi:hypothetical protein
VYLGQPDGRLSGDLPIPPAPQRYGLFVGLPGSRQIPLQGEYLCDGSSGLGFRIGRRRTITSLRVRYRLFPSLKEPCERRLAILL